MSNLNKQAVYDLFFRIGKTAGITKIATPPKQHKSRTKKGLPTTEELELLKKLRDAGNTLEANNLEDMLKSTYPEYNKATSTSKNPTAGNIPDDAATRLGNIRQMNLNKGGIIADILLDHDDNFNSGEEKSYVSKGSITDGQRRGLAQLDSQIFSETDKNQAKYIENKELALQKLDDTVKMLGQYPELKQILGSNMSNGDKKGEIKKLMASRYYDDEGRLQPPPQQPSPTVASVAPEESDQIIDDQGISDAVDDLVAGFNRNRRASNNAIPPQKQEILQDTSTEQSGPGFLESVQSKAEDIGSYIKNQAGNLSSSAKNQYNKYQEGRAEKIRQEALRKAQQEAAETQTPQPSNATKAPVVEISEETMQSINNDLPVTQPQTSSPTTAPIAAKQSKPVIRMLPLEDVQQEVTTPAPVAQPSTPATPQTPKLTDEELQRRLADLEYEIEVETQRGAAPQADAKINKELAKLNRKPQVDTFDRTKALNNLKGGLGEQSPSYVDTSKIESDPISADRTYSSYLPAIDPSARLNFGMGETPPDLVFTEEDLAALNSQYPEASPIDTPPVVPQTPRATNNNAAVAPSAESTQQGNDFLSNLTSRISSGNFGPAPSAARAAAPSAARAAAPVARSQNRAVSAPRVARKPRPVAKPTFDRKGYGDMMSDFGYNNTSPKPIPQNLTNLMPKRTTPINSVVGPAKPLNQILSNKPTATTSPAPKPVMDTTATTKAPPQIKQSFLSQFGIY